ncbi:1,4-dihydroxy-2-naphthoate octaprenyltransferase [Austwickia sp. TVS 96-490-7B]|uniref:1,4-dihydroxy-2-naphthoate polyprenyltransferase n=1 Tax=Austwickia sp. TVS 96-490-7B TaxID=2830843 RepID=UPI001C581310|nr:1,4-dihydroxy-2-naphthoate polyprenyltransferase [Austwickia sp. TVS 96-490-7B]MBW3084768.1 1,4-dihydroxy-2-naphthoate octaprenyltransferase [Austwickia sp. TVS 96-490-7B]
MASLRDWVEGARPRTLPAAVAPVVIGTGAAAAIGKASAAAALLALLVAVSLQIGCNYANDYSDGIRGTDAERVGPVRLVGQGLADPDDVKLAAFACFGFAAMTGLALCALANTFWILLLGAAAIFAAWFYTGGSSPYGYLGLGEVFVFVFFGLVAVMGTQYTQALQITTAGWAGAVGCGALSCAILMVNNIRDIPGDRVAGKRTLAVRLGERYARLAYAGMIAVALGTTIATTFHHAGALAGLAAFGLAPWPVAKTLQGSKGRDLIPVLAATGRLTLAFGVLFGIGIALAPQPLLG